MQNELFYIKVDINKLENLDVRSSVCFELESI